MEHDSNRNDDDDDVVDDNDNGSDIALYRHGLKTSSILCMRVTHISLATGCCKLFSSHCSLRFVCEMMLVEYSPKLKDRNS